MLVYSTLFLSLRRPSFLNPLNVLYYHCHFKFLPRTHLHSTQYIVCYGRKYFAVFTIYPGTQIVQHCGLTLLYHKGPDKCLVQSHKTIVYFTESPHQNPCEVSAQSDRFELTNVTSCSDLVVPPLWAETGFKMANTPVDPLQTLQAAWSAPPNSSEQAELLTTLREALEIQPAPIPILSQTLINVVANTGDSLVKRWVLDLVHFAICRSSLTLEVRTQS